MDAVTVDDQRSFIKIEVLRGKTGKEIHDALTEACGGYAVSFKTVYRWVARFRSGKYDISDESRSGRDVSVTDHYHVEKVKELLAVDRRYTCEEIANSVGISQGSAHTILTRNLGMRKVAARWVPHCLTQAQIQARLDTARDLLKRYEQEGETFLNRIVAIDETWVRSYEPELKRQSSEWHTPSSPRPAKFRRSQGNLKMLMVFAYDNTGVLSSHSVPIGQNVNSEYYAHFLQKILRPAIRKKRPALLKEGPVILHDNATSHVSAHVTSLMTSYAWERLRHPPYSPDLSPCDFDLFPKIKESLRGIRFQDLDTLNAAVATEVRRVNAGCLATGIKALPKRWKSVIEHHGGYIEGL